MSVIQSFRGLVPSAASSEPKAGKQGDRSSLLFPYSLLSDQVTVSSDVSIQQNRPAAQPSSPSKGLWQRVINFFKGSGDAEKSNSSLTDPNIFDSRQSPIIPLFNDSSSFTQGMIAPGIWYDRTRKTIDGARINVLAIDTKIAQVEAAFINGVQTMSPAQMKSLSGVNAAINATFFGPGLREGTYGDLLGAGKVYKDENIGSGYDSISDRRYYLAVTKDGKVRFGRGGLSESGLEKDLTCFVGGMGKIFNKKELATLDKDIRSGVFQQRLRNQVKDKSFPNTDLVSSISRTFAGVLPSGKLLLVTLGEGESRDFGASFAEAARIMRGLGATEAYALDGGGSTHNYVKGVHETQTDGRLVKSYIISRTKPPVKAPQKPPVAPVKPPVKAPDLPQIQPVLPSEKIILK